MPENKLVGSLVLRTKDINSAELSPCPTALNAVDNDFGTCSANGAYITWKM
jgi:hypothetical protein